MSMPSKRKPHFIASQKIFQGYTKQEMILRSAFPEKDIFYLKNLHRTIICPSKLIQTQIQSPIEKKKALITGRIIIFGDIRKEVHKKGEKKIKDSLATDLAFDLDGW